jgi:mono/diheme cytochrome c family protein
MPMPSPPSRVLNAAWLVAAVTALAAPLAMAVTATDALSAYRAAAGGTPSAERGQQLFVNKHGREWSCASCHGATPTRTGQHAGTGKPIAALAPAVNAERFADTAKTEKWFRRNCNDVLGRECSAGEKADVLAWLLTLKP